MSGIELYLEKEEAYYAVSQSWIVDLFDDVAVRVLDVGCGAGATGALLKQTGVAREVHGIELVASAAQRAEAYLDSVIANNIEELAELPYQPGSFDYIIATELLEHLVNPWRTIQRLTPYLVDGGCMIASSPNIRNISIIWALAVRGSWQYVDSGILDKTHLRFFTKSSFISLFTLAGLKVEVIKPMIPSRLSRAINRLTLGVCDGFLASRYVCRARKQMRVQPASGIAPLPKGGGE